MGIMADTFSLIIARSNGSAGAADGASGGVDSVDMFMVGSATV